MKIIIIIIFNQLILSYILYKYIFKKEKVKRNERSLIGNYIVLFN